MGVACWVRFGSASVALTHTNALLMHFSCNIGPAECKGTWAGALHMLLRPLSSEECHHPATRTSPGPTPTTRQATEQMALPGERFSQPSPQLAPGALLSPHSAAVQPMAASAPSEAVLLPDHSATRLPKVEGGHLERLSLQQGQLWSHEREKSTVKAPGRRGWKHTHTHTHCGKAESKPGLVCCWEAAVESPQACATRVAWTTTTTPPPGVGGGSCEQGHALSPGKSAPWNVNCPPKEGGSRGWGGEALPQP